MQKRRVRRMVLPKITPKRAALAAACAAVVALVIALCITAVMRSNIQRDYTNARDEIGEELYAQLYMLCQTFDQVSVPGQDLQNVVIPRLKEYYAGAQTLNNAMYNAFGAKYSVLSQDILSGMDQAFDAYEAAFKGGKSTQEATDSMRGYVDTIRNLLMTRFRDGILKAA